MKKLSALFITAIFTLNCFAYDYTFTLPGRKENQHWITAGVRGTFNSTWLLDKNMQHDKGLKYVPSWGYAGGIMLGFHMNEIVAIDVEGMYAVYSQRYKDGEKDSLHWTARTDLKHIEIPILLRFDFENYKYLEFGVRIGILNKASQSYTPENFPTITNEGKDPLTGDSYFEKKNMGLVFGWGGGIWGNGGLLLSGGLRFTYGLSDIISDAGGKGTQYHPMDTSTAIQDYTPTHTATIGFHLIADFDIGWFITSSCGRNHKFMMFSH